MQAPEALSTGVDVYCIRPIRPQNISATLKKIFPHFDFFFWDLSDGKGLSGSYNAQNAAHAFFGTETFENSKRFPFKICVETPAMKQPNVLFLKLCRELSIKFKMKCFCEYVKPDDPNNPYYSILFDQGSGFLVDDSRWDEKEELRILRPFKIDQ